VALLATNTFTEADDLLLLNLEDAENGEIALQGFGAQGNDQIYVGTGYSLFAIGEDQDIFDNVGSMSAIEILWQQVNNDLVLYFEETPFAANGSTTGDIVTVTLTGVTGEVELSSTGFLTVV
jgi:hypothetical protein